MSIQNLFKTFAVIQPDLQAMTRENSPSLYQELDEDFNQFKGHSLVAAHRFTEDWATWEKHPAGDEIVLLLSGTCTLLVKADNTVHDFPLAKLGDYAIVPKDSWHTAKVAEPTELLFITPGEGTENKA